MFMADYIVCHRKRNSPRLNVRICQEKCPFKEDCKEYMAYLKMSVHQNTEALSRESAPVVLAAP
jgi:hypothetical protein